MNQHINFYCVSQHELDSNYLKILQLAKKHWYFLLLYHLGKLRGRKYTTEKQVEENVPQNVSFIHSTIT